MVILYIYSTCWRIKSVFYECQQTHVQIGMVNGLERCPEYDMVCGKFCSNQLRTDFKE
jgi:hypothetical protein